MANDRRIARLESSIRERLAQLLQREVKDPRLGFVTIQRVELDREITRAKVFWSVMGDDNERRTTERALASANRFLAREVAATLTTRHAPRLEFVFDESIEGMIRLEKLFQEVLPNTTSDEATADGSTPTRRPAAEEPPAEGKGSE
ncbi:MAG: 30S ribosome-binding factor RbfA [Planctomycetes bacterium]|nr:30S ribosome-binding factor RbfA [Planctomycetota bacterium]MCB9918533.1 30S ribosome-binding factor RbfA [Planctomycetota bacterium]